MAPSYKLTYFDGRGRAEAIRFLFHYGGIAFEDNRIDKKGDWPKIKNSTPFGQVPILEFNGKVANQSLSICRYVAKQVGLAGKDDWEDLEIDSVVDTISDFRLKIRLALNEADEQKKKTLLQQCIDETLPYYFSRFDNLTKKNDGYLTSTRRLTWADVIFVVLTENVPEALGGDVLSSYPGLKALCTKVLGLPNIKKWVEKRPKTAS